MTDWGELLEYDPVDEVFYYDPPDGAKPQEKTTDTETSQDKQTLETLRHISVPRGCFAESPDGRDFQVGLRRTRIRRSRKEC